MLLDNYDRFLTVSPNAFSNVSHTDSENEFKIQVRSGSLCSGIVQIESTLFYPFRGQNVPRSPLPLVCKAQTGKQKYLLISDITRSPKYLLCFFRHMQFYFCSKTSLILVFNSKLVGLNDL